MEKDHLEIITKSIHASIDVRQAILKDNRLLSQIQLAVDAIIACIQQGGKVLFCGNGGSAADAQHLAAELSGRFYKDRAPLFAEALHVNTSYITAVANDYSFDEIYSRLVDAKGRKGDVLVSLSTSGNSRNVIAAMEKAAAKEMTNIAFSGETGGNMKSLADVLLNVPSNDVPRIQEAHILLGHIICERAESLLFA